jgi:glycine cleavage system aminomethyltransferase T
MKTENSFRIYRVPLPVREGWTPLALLAVVQNPDPDLFRRMLAEGADPTLLPEGYDSLAHLRREWGFWLMKHDVHLEPFETFLEVGAMIRALERGDTPAPAP